MKKLLEMLIPLILIAGVITFVVLPNIPKVINHSVDTVTKVIEPVNDEMSKNDDKKDKKEKDKEDKDERKKSRKKEHENEGSGAFQFYSFKGAKGDRQSGSDVPQISASKSVSIGGEEYAPDKELRFLAVDWHMSSSGVLGLKVQLFHQMKPVKSEGIFFVGDPENGRVIRSSWWKSRQKKRCWKSPNGTLRITRMTTLPDFKEGVSSLAELAEQEEVPVKDWQPELIRKWASVYLSRGRISLAKQSWTLPDVTAMKIRTSVKNAKCVETFFAVKNNVDPGKCWLVELSFAGGECTADDVDQAAKNFFEKMTLL